MTGRPQAAFTTASDAERSRLTAAWLFAVAACVLAVMMVGGATRLTGSGLSITQWKPVSGVLPPMSGAAWTRLFHLYQATTQYRALNAGMSLAAFKAIFWWEWLHRLVARALGAAFAITFGILVATRRLPRRLRWPCVALLILGGLQGLAGWLMVETGLEGRVAVAPEALATHLGLAFALICALVWTGLDAWSGPAPLAARRHDGWPLAAGLFLLGVYLQCLLGALVAGNHAGLIDGDWPLMAGRFVPDDYWQGALWPTLAHGLAAVQFNHRLAAYALAVFAMVMALRAWRSAEAGEAIRRLSRLLVGLVFVQAGLGVATLMTGVALPVAMLHQATAAVLLAATTAFAWRARRFDGIMLPIGKIR